MKPCIFLVLLLAACAHRPAPVPSSPLAAKPASVPAAPRALTTAKIAEVRAQPFFEFAWGERKVRVAHGLWRVKSEDKTWNDSYGYGPVVWITQGKNTRVLDLRAEFPSHFVSHVFHSDESGRIYLFLDYGIEGPAPAYIVWATADRGEHWSRLPDLTRPPGTFPPAELETFALDAAGHGTAWFRLPASQLEPAARANVPLSARLYYRVTTDDAGQSWQPHTGPEYSSLLEEAEEKHR